MNIFKAFLAASIPVALGIILVIACGKDPEPNPGPGPNPSKTFELHGKFIDVKGTVKTVSVEQAKLAATMALKNLEGK